MYQEVCRKDRLGIYEELGTYRKVPIQVKVSNDDQYMDNAIK